MRPFRGPEWRSRLAGVGVSLLIHLAALVVLVTLYHPTPVERRVTLIPLEVGQPLVPPRIQAPPPRRVEPPRAEQRTAVPPLPPEVVDIPPPPAAGPVGPRDSVGVGGPAPIARGRLEPSYGDGRLWIPPVDVLQLGRVLPQAPSGPVGVGQLDSLVTARLLAFLDSMPPDSFAPPQAPRWTTEIGGQTWGIDGRWIYLGPVKLPAALLALLPISLPQGNYDQIRAAADLQRMREDILRAAQRAETAAEFNRYVQELRKRRDAEREQRRRVARDTIIP
ncbi:MAG TPA: hypothetical protein VD793_10695 [Gemmatimonadales bacterium]|nr:hypothetical protein [Gemmatimonadales bacterium]